MSGTATSVRALDHYVVQVHDLEAAGASYERLGFQVLPRMEHIEIGTSNRVVQIGNTYLELFGGLAGVDHPLLAEYLPRFDCGEGLSHVSLRSYDFEADHREVAQLGLNPREMYSARRRIDMPDGSIDETDSSFFYIWRPQRLYLSLFLSVHNKPGTIWIPEYLSHPNTATETRGITWVSDDPQQDIEYFQALYRTEPTINAPDKVRFIGARQDFARIISRERAQDEYQDVGLNICNKLAGYPVALSFDVAHLETCQAVLEVNDVPYVSIENGVRVAAHDAHGAVIDFRMRENT